jgi:hypothetical protein
LEETTERISFKFVAFNLTVKKLMKKLQENTSEHSSSFTLLKVDVLLPGMT